MRKIPKYIVPVILVFLIIFTLLWWQEIPQVVGKIIYLKWSINTPTNLEFSYQDCYEADRYYEQIEEKKWIEEDSLYIKARKSYNCSDIYFVGDYEIKENSLILKTNSAGYTKTQCSCPVLFEYTIKGIEKKEYEIKF